MRQPFASVTVDEGVVVTAGEANGFRVAEFRFPPNYVQTPFEPEQSYLAVVLDGGVEKAFRVRTLRLGRAAAVTMPAGAKHCARFSSDGARIVVVKSKRTDDGVLRIERLAELRPRTLVALAWRLAGELRAADAAAPLAAEGLALELFAAANREASDPPRVRTRPAWLDHAEECLRSCAADRLTLRDLAFTVGVHPTHLARVFRAYHGVSVGEYVRRARLDWALAQVAGSAAPLAQIAAQAGFADQSHFTRLFKHHVGTTPGRYREEVRETRSGR